MWGGGWCRGSWPGVPGDGYDDEPATAGQWLPHPARVVGVKPPMRVPRWLARLPAGEVAVIKMTGECGFSKAKAERKLGRRPRHVSWRQGFKEELA